MGQEPRRRRDRAGETAGRREDVPNVRSLRAQGMARQRGREDAPCQHRPGLSRQTPRHRAHQTRNRETAKAHGGERMKQYSRNVGFLTGPHSVEFGERARLARTGRRPADQPTDGNGSPSVRRSGTEAIGETPMAATGTVALPRFLLNRSGSG